MRSSSPRELSRVDYILRRRLIHALKDRRWSSLEAERAAAGIAELCHAEAGEWWAWPSRSVMGPDLYRVARDEDAISVYDSPIKERVLDVVGALNELDRHGSDATGIPGSGTERDTVARKLLQPTRGPVGKHGSPDTV